MSNYQSQYASTQGAGGRPSASAVAPARRPGTLVAAVWLSLLAAALGILGGAVDIAGGKQSIQKALNAAAQDLGVDPSIVQQIGADELSKAYDTLVTKAIVAIVLSVVVLVLALAARNAARWARITLTVALVAAMCAGSGLQLGDRDALPSISVIAAALIPLLGLAAIVLMFLPPVNRYAAGRRNA